MGNDGGTIPRRDELVKLKKRKEQKDKDSELSFRWRHCAITQEALEEPIAACGLGRLYKKQAVIEGLLDRSAFPETASHIKSLKDIRELRLTPNPAFKAGENKGDGFIDHRASPYICPLTGLEINGRFRFVYLWSCGCVFAERAIKEIKDRNCHKCQTPFTQEDIIVLNGTEEEVNRLHVRMEARQARQKAEKRAKSEAKRQPTQNIEKEKSNTPPLAGSSLAPAAAVSATSIPGASKVGISSISSQSSKPFTGEKRSAAHQMNDPAFKKSRDSYSVASDPKATEVFKSLFTSHKSHEKQTRAHWITYNPFYN